MTGEANKENNLKKNKLEGWKQIASYMDESVRSLQRKEEKHGLPIHRTDDTPKARVYANKSELDQWQWERTRKWNHNQNDFSNEKSESPGKRIGSLREGRYFKYYTIIPLLLVLFAAILLFQYQDDPQPADFKIVGSKLVILDENKNEMWSYNTGVEYLTTEEEYRKHFQFKREIIQQTLFHPMLIIKDLDKDGKTEVLFATYHQNWKPPGEVILFNWKGKELWHLKVDRDMKYGDRLYSDYRVFGLYTSDLDNDGDDDIIVHFAHWDLFPSALMIVDLEKNIIGEYWNSGRLNDFIFTDLNGDGRKDIVVAGMNNEYKKGCLIVFDSREVFGGSPQIQSYYKINSLRKGSEKYYILFPRTKVEKERVGGCYQVSRLQNGRIRAVLRETILYYEFDPGFELRDIQTSHTFELLYEKAVREGIIDSKPDKEYLNELVAAILYYNGKEFTSKPSTANNWKVN